MAGTAVADDMLTLAEAEMVYGVKRATLYRYVQQGRLRTYRRGMDRRAYVRRTDIEAVRRFSAVASLGGPTPAAVERARAFRRRVFGGRMLPSSSAELIEAGRLERADVLL